MGFGTKFLHDKFLDPLALEKLTDSRIGDFPTRRSFQMFARTVYENTFMIACETELPNADAAAQGN